MENCDCFFSRKILAKRWNCSVNTISRYVKEDLIPYLNTPGGRTLLFPIDAILDYEQNQMQNRKEVNRKPKKKRKVLSAPIRKWRAE
jgi:hypothetical protein